MQIISLELGTPQARQMIQHMRDTENDGDDTRCDCGLLLEKSSLPRGWSVHLSKDAETLGEVSFLLAFLGH